MTSTTYTPRFQTWKGVDPHQLLAGAVVRLALEDAKQGDRTAILFLLGGGSAPLFFDAITPPGNDSDEVRKLALGQVLS